MQCAKLVNETCVFAYVYLEPVPRKYCLYTDLMLLPEMCKTLNVNKLQPLSFSIIDYVIIAFCSRACFAQPESTLSCKNENEKPVRHFMTFLCCGKKLHLNSLFGSNIFINIQST